MACSAAPFSSRPTTCAAASTRCSTSLDRLDYGGPTPRPADRSGPFFGPGVAVTTTTQSGRPRPRSVDHGWAVAADESRNGDPLTLVTVRLHPHHGSCKGALTAGVDRICFLFDDSRD